MRTVPRPRVKADAAGADSDDTDWCAWEDELAGGIGAHLRRHAVDAHGGVRQGRIRAGEDNAASQ